MALFLVCGLGLGLILALLAQPYWVALRRRRVAGQSFPASWRKLLRRRVPLVGHLPARLQLQLKKHIQVFLSEKVFIGCAGLHITDEMRVVIAAQACFLVLNRSMDHFQHVRQVLVYPGAFVVNRATTDGAGVLQEHRQALAGESWSQGQVILSWQDTLHGAAVPDDGRNVVIHEFAHQLDQENGAARGAPPPAPGDAQHNAQRWSQVFHAAYADLQDEVCRGHDGLLNHYGAHDPAEFFAVVSEVFFEQPKALTHAYPALYQELCGYYKTDPAAW